MVASPQLRRALTEVQVRQVMESPLSSRALAKELRVSPTTVQRIRNGMSYRNHAQEAPPQPKRATRSRAAARHTCAECRFFQRGRCDFEFPEARPTSTFASTCVLFALEADPTA